MGVVTQTLEALAGVASGSQLPELYVPASSTVYAPSWAFGLGFTHRLTYSLRAVNYGGGVITVDIDWHAPESGSTTGTVIWTVAVVAQTPGDSEAFDAQTNGATTSGTTTVNSTLGGPNRTTISVPQASADAIASGDNLQLIITRGGAGTMTQRAMLDRVTVSYSDGVAPGGAGDFVGPASSTAGNLVSYADATGKLGSDSGVAASNLVTASAASAGAGRLAFAAGANRALSYSAASVDAAGALTGVTTINGAAVATGNAVGAASSVTGNVVSFSGADGKTLADSGKLASALVTSSTTSTGVDEVAVWSDTAGRIIKGGSTSIGSLVKNTGAAVVDGRMVQFFGTSGLDIRDSGKLAADIVTGPASAVSGNIASFNATTGKIIQDSGVSATAHAARHNPGGADAMFPGTWAANERPTWTGSAWVNKLDTVVATTADFNVTAAINTLADITGLTITLPRAGTYRFDFSSVNISSGTAGTFWFAANYTGTVTRIFAGGVSWQTTASGGASIIMSQVANNALSATGSNGGTSAVGTGNATLSGTITVSTTGTFSMRCARAATATTIAIKAGASFIIREL